MSTLEVNKITPVSGGTTVQIGESGDTINIPAGATIANAGTATGFGVSLANGADNRVVTASSASALNGESTLTYDGSDLGVGIATPTFTNGNGLHLNSVSANLRLHLTNTATGTTASDGTDIAVGSDGALNIINKENAVTRLYTNDTERLHIQANGKVITKANNNGAEGLQVLHSGDANPYGIFIYFDGTNPNNSANYFARGDSTTGAKFFIYSNGNMVNSNNSYGGISDLKLKEQVKDSSSQWEDIKALKIKKYKFKKDVAEGDNDNLWQLGVIAQDLETAGMNGLVEESPDTETTLDEDGQTYHKDLGTTTKSVKYSVLYMKSIKALQEAMAKIETLEAKVQALESA